jgi:ABC-type branched-subunit amino acid transport system ATPase component
MVMTILEAKDVVTGYGRTEIVHGVSVSISAGEVVSIIGPNGAGKSTFIKAVAGSLALHSGEVSLTGADVSTASQDIRTRKGLGYVPQTKDVFPSLTVRENLAMGGYLCHRKEVEKRREVVLERFPQLKRVIDSRAGKLSGGERKLVGIGRVLMANPTVLLLDEPSAGLSPQYARVVLDHIEALAADGQALLIVEQHAVEALQISHKAMVLVAGRSVYYGSAPQLLHDEDLGQMFLGRRS